MIAKIIQCFAGSHYKRFNKKCAPIIAKINKIEEGYQSLTDDQLRAKTDEFKQRYAGGESLDSILPEAFAAVKNAARRLCGKSVTVCGHDIPWNMVHYDVQLIGGIALHENKIAEMATGEGKTLVATLPLYLNALTGKGCHLVTVNEYLAKRDSEWMGYLYKFLGLTVSWIYNMQGMEEKMEAYKADITYGTASEFGFDYLRDNGMTHSAAGQVQRPHYYCIVDEVDSVLIDEARTPLIISGPVQEEREAPYGRLKPLIEKVVKLQTKLCNNLINEVRAKVESGGKLEEADIIKAWQVKLGAPKNRILRQLMENGPFGKALDKIDMEMAADFRKIDNFKYREELYYVIDEKQHTSDLTEKGRTAIYPENPDAFVLPDLPTIFMEIDADASLDPQRRQEAKIKAEDRFIALSEEIHTVSQLLRAYSIYEKDVEYVVQDGKVHIVDPNTGRIMYGRRWSEGLHQAVEAKENVKIEKETKTYATITIQNYFRLYEKLAGMTGTAETEAQEFHDIYGLNVMAIPTNKPCRRVDLNDVIYKTRREKYNAAIDEIEAAHRRGQPVLVGTASVEASELLSRLLKRKNIPHTLLNAKHHEQEAEIVSRAGERGAVTIATNMAGRGTDIKLGEGVDELGGLYVLGTERHEARRIDRQLRGRCARQGDNGTSKFLVSLEDDLFRISGKVPFGKLLDRTFTEGQPIDHPLLNRSIQHAQKAAEGRNYSIRKRLLQYDDVLNKQREVIYGLRNEVLTSDQTRAMIFDFINDELDEKIAAHVNKGETSDLKSIQTLCSWVTSRFPIAIIPEQLVGKNLDEMREAIVEEIKAVYKIREEVEDPEALKAIERFVMLRALDKNWQDHLTEIEDLRRSIGLRGYGQKDPLNEYKSEAFKYFERLMDNIRNDVCLGVFRSASSMEVLQAMISKMQEKLRSQNAGRAVEEDATPQSRIAAHQPAQSDSKKEIRLPEINTKIELPKIGRNDMVTIQKNGEVQTLKFKKAENMIREEGWILKEWKK